MPAITSGKVLVSGANGFIAGWIVKTLLERGFLVRGTVRSVDRAIPTRAALRDYEDRLEFVEVGDITQAGAFDEAVSGVDAIVHVASPVHLSAHDPQELIQPALNGTTSILRSASAPGSSVKRFVFISSLAAVVNARLETAVFNETDWNETDPAEVNEKGVDASPISKYRSSKVLAERAAWNYFEEGRANGTIDWDLVSLCPPWVFGPVLGAQTPQDLNFSVKQWYTLAVKEEGEVPTWSKASWTDVRDFAEATIAALTKPEAGGERFVISAGPYAWPQWITLARRLLGKPSSEDDSADFKFGVVFDSKKSQQVMGIRYRDMEETARFMIEDFRTKGWC